MISAAAIARGLQLGEVQVRKDLASVSGAGKPKVGYERIALIKALEECLGYDKVTNAVLVGAGKLGRALLDYEGFEEFGVKIVAGFDCNASNLQSGKKDILPLDKLVPYCVENDIKLGVITVGQDAAQEVCDRLIENGITAIWNFAPCTLDVPAGVSKKRLMESRSASNLLTNFFHLDLILECLILVADTRLIILKTKMNT